MNNIIYKLNLKSIETIFIIKSIGNRMEPTTPYSAPMLTMKHEGNTVEE